MKSITQERLIATLDKISAFFDKFAKRELDVSMAALRLGFKLLATSAVPIDTQRDKDILKLTARYHDVLSYEELEELHVSLFRKSDYVHQKRDRVRRIQEKYQVSGLRQEKCVIGDASIDRWRPVHDQLNLLDSDLELLKSERDKMLQFWVDLVALNGLTPYRRLEERWTETSLDFCRLAASEHDWVDMWDDLQWIKPVNQYIPPGYAVSLETSKAPTDGYEKHFEIHLRLGDGKEWEHCDSVWLCACNEVPHN